MLLVTLLVVATAGECGNKRWIMILGTGRSGSTSALRMINQLPGVVVTGEHHGQLLELRKFHEKLDKTAKMHGPAWTPQLERRRFACWVHLWYANVTGFKEIRYNSADMLEFIARVFPTARFVLTYRMKKDAQLRSRKAAPGFKPNAAALEAETQALLQFHERRPDSTFLLPLERFSLATFNSLFAFLGFPHCKALRVAHTNKNGGYGDDHRSRNLVQCDTRS